MLEQGTKLRDMLIADAKALVTRKLLNGELLYDELRRRCLTGAAPARTGSGSSEE